MREGDRNSCVREEKEKGRKRKRMQGLTRQKAAVSKDPLYWEKRKKGGGAELLWGEEGTEVYFHASSVQEKKTSFEINIGGRKRKEVLGDIVDPSRGEKEETLELPIRT